MVTAEEYALLAKRVYDAPDDLRSPLSPGWEVLDPPGWEVLGGAWRSEAHPLPSRDLMPDSRHFGREQHQQITGVRPIVSVLGKEACADIMRALF